MKTRPKNPILIGRKPVADAIQSGKSLEGVYVDVAMRGDWEIKIRNLCKQHELPLYKVDEAKLNRMSRGNHQGVAAVVSPIEYKQLEHMIPFWFEKGLAPLVLILDGVTDVGNMGAIARSAEVLGAHAIVVPMKGTALINDIALKSSAGALLRLPVCREKSLANAVDLLKESGYSIFIADRTEGAVELEKADFRGPSAVVLGSEGEGVGQHLSRKSDFTISIPQSGETESLNVSVAAGIILYEIQRQRKISNT